MVAPATVSRRAVLGGLVLGGPALLLACANDGPETAGSPSDPADAPPATPPPRLSPATRQIAYGDGPEQYGQLDVPDGPPPSAGWPVAVLVHGGFWRGGSLDLMFDIARSLLDDGWATWNIQYTLTGEPGGGWPGTFLDVADAIDHLETIDEPPLDLARVIAIGHSAGGHLALWAAGRPGLPPGASGAEPAVRIAAVVSQAGVTDLLRCVQADMGDGACVDFMGARPGDDLERYLLASPIERLPSGVPTLLVHGDRDLIVPAAQSVRFAVRANEVGESPELLIVEGADHFSPIQASHDAWRLVRERLPFLIG